MIRRPPRSTLFPYNDALPISLPFSFAGYKFAWLNRGFVMGSGLLSLSFGLFVCYQIGFVGGLFTNRSEEHTSELQSQSNLVCRLLLEKKKYKFTQPWTTVIVH